MNPRLRAPAIARRGSMPAATPSTAEAAARTTANLHPSRRDSAGTRRFSQPLAATAPDLSAALQRLSLSRGSIVARGRELRWRWGRGARLAAGVVVIVGPLRPRGPNHGKAGGLDTMLGEQLAKLGELIQVCPANPGDDHHV